MRFSKVSFLALLFLCLMSLIPRGLASTVTVAEAPYYFSYADAARGDHFPERETWDARATADLSTGIMESYIWCSIDGAGWLQVYFYTSMGEDFIYTGPDGNTITMTISSIVYMFGHAHLFGFNLFGSYSTVWNVDLWMNIHDYTTGESILDLLVREWEDSETASTPWVTDRGHDWNEDVLIPPTTVTIEANHYYRVSIVITGAAGVSVLGVAQTQSKIDFETDDYHTKVESLIFTYDIPYEYGDIIDDDFVDMRDIGIVTAAYGSYPGHPRWNPLADINNDYKVDGRDLGIVARNFGSQVLIS